MANSKTSKATIWITRLIVVSCVAISAIITVPTMAWAADMPPSPPAAELFEVHCAGCHPHGGNIIRRGKTLKQRALQRHGYDTEPAIVQIITNGKSLMSSYSERLSPEEIQSLAQYVLDQAHKNWP